MARGQIIMSESSEEWCAAVPLCRPRWHHKSGLGKKQRFWCGLW